MPRFIADAPWYSVVSDADSSKDTLSHQRLSRDDSDGRSSVATEYHRPAAEAAPTTSRSVAVVRFKRGNCENCGSAEHTTRDCLERPRKRNARAVGKDLVVEKIPRAGAGDSSASSAGLQPRRSFSEKHDRWVRVAGDEADAATAGRARDSSIQQEPDAEGSSAIFVPAALNLPPKPQYLENDAIGKRATLSKLQSADPALRTVADMTLFSLQRPGSEGMFAAPTSIELEYRGAQRRIADERERVKSAYQAKRE